MPSVVDEGWESPTQAKDEEQEATARAPVPAGVTQGTTLSAEAREQVWAIVRAAIDEALAPLKKSLVELDVKSRTLEAKLKDLDRRPPSNAPGPVVVPSAPAAPKIVGAIPADDATAKQDNPFMKVASVEPAWKVIGEDATGLVHVSIAPPAPPLPGSDRSSPLPADLMATFDAGRKRKRVTTMIVAALLLFVGGLVVMMLMSYR
jgi:hypothetical protein